MKLSNRAKAISPSVTLAITAKAGQLKQEGKDIISFGAGEPDFNTPENIMNAAKKAMAEGKTKYTAASGIKELKEAVCAKFKADNGLDYTADQVVISTGAKQCLANAFLAIVDDGDEVLMAVPYWVSYPELIKLAGGQPVFLNGDEKDNYKLTPDLIKSNLTDRSVAIVINSPNNPAGTIYTEAELKAIAEVCQEHDLWIIADEMYEKLIYGQDKHVSIAALSEDAYKRTLTINGVSKAYAMTGWRIGYAAGDAQLIKKMSSIQSHTTSNPSSISQYAALEALTGDQRDMEAMVERFAQRRDLTVSLLKDIPGIACIEPKGAFYVMMDIRKLLGKSYQGQVLETGMDFTEKLLEDKLVAVVPGEGFGLPGYIRISYATSEENIEKGIGRIAEFIGQLN